MRHAACVTCALASPDHSHLVSQGHFQRHFQLALLCTYYRSRDPLICSHHKSGPVIYCSHSASCLPEALMEKSTQKPDEASGRHGPQARRACWLQTVGVHHELCFQAKRHHTATLYGPSRPPSARLFLPERNFRASRRYPVKLHKRRTQPCNSSRSYRKRTLLYWFTIRHS